MKFRLFIAAIVLAFSHITFADDMPPKPSSCPSTQALKATPFFMAQEAQGQGYAAVSMGQYQTDAQWGFLMAFFKVSSAMEAVMAANKQLPNVAGNPEPMAVRQQGHKFWACMYGVRGSSLQAIAITPLNGLTNMSSVLR